MTKRKRNIWLNCHKVRIFSPFIWIENDLFSDYPFGHVIMGIESGDVMLRVSNLHLNLDQSMELLERRLMKKLNIVRADLVSMNIYKESIDARKKSQIFFRYTLDCVVKNEKEVLARNIPDVSIAPDLSYQAPIAGDKELSVRPIVIGFGPAGMFSALSLAQQGYCPIVYERGGDVDSRIAAVESFWENGVLNERSNVQFGEGGAGTFSDGKLTTRVKDLRGHKVLAELVEAGAEKEILYEAHPHIGTDKLRNIVKKIREDIIALGGEVHFNHQLDDMIIENDQLSKLVINGETIECGPVILAIGHSARDTFSMLHDHHVEMLAKPFAVGVRIEHPQTMIDEAQYGEAFEHPRLPSAEYRLTHKARNGRGVYTFCMCPGGVIVPSTSHEGHLVTNGMSEHARDKENANSGLIVQVGPEDFGNHPLDGVKFQEELERKAFIMGGGNYQAPAQLVSDFLKNRPSLAIGSIKPSYSLGVNLCDLNELFPDYISDALKEGILAFDRKIKGFAQADAIMSGVESRSSSPLRILRDQDSFIASKTNNLYPCGEGAGYAGGIVSAAIDGIRCAEAIIKLYQPIKK